MGWRVDMSGIACNIYNFFSVLAVHWWGPENLKVPHWIQRRSDNSNITHPKNTSIWLYVLCSFFLDHLIKYIHRGKAISSTHAWWGRCSPLSCLCTCWLDWYCCHHGGLHLPQNRIRWMACCQSLCHGLFHCYLTSLLGQFFILSLDHWVVSGAVL